MPLPRRPSLFRFARYVAVTVALVTTGCSSSSGPSTGAGSDGSITVTDASGREVTVPRQVERIAVLDRGPAEIITALGLGDKLVGIHESIDGDALYPDLQGLPTVATWSEVNLEAIAEAEPQVVISSVEGGHGAVTDSSQLERFDIVDIEVNLRDPRTMSDEIEMLGKAFDRSERAAELVAFYDHWLAEIANGLGGLADADRPSAFLQTHPGLLNTGGADSAWFDQVEIAGARNISAALQGLPEVDGEWVTEQNPDFIIIEGSELGFDAESADDTDAPALRDEVTGAPGLRETTAVTRDQVYVLPIDLVSRPGYIVGEAYLAKILHPDRFADLDPTQVHADYLELFHPGVTLTGTWVYPAVD